MNKIRRLTISVMAVGMLFPRALYAAFSSAQRGTSGAQFLEIEPGARPAAMGYAFSGVADDIQAIYYNPAGLAELTDVQVTAMEDQYFQGINYNFGAVEVPLLSWDQAAAKQAKNLYGVLGIAVYNLSVSNIESRGVSETALPTGTFGSEDFAYSLSYAYHFQDTGLSLGASGKFIQSNLDGYNAAGFAADLGALYKFDVLSLGAGIRNLGPQYGYTGQTDPLPLSLYVGGGYHITPSWLGTFEIDAPRDNNPALSLGTEYVCHFTSKLSGAIRAGYSSQNTDAGGLTGATFGGGIGYANFSFDFAFLPFGDLGNAYQYSLTVKF